MSYEAGMRTRWFSPGRVFLPTLLCLPRALGLGREYLCRPSVGPGAS